MPDYALVLAEAAKVWPELNQNDKLVLMYRTGLFDERGNYTGGSHGTD